MTTKAPETKKAPESYLDCRRPPPLEALMVELAEGGVTFVEAVDSLIRKGYFTPRPRPWGMGYRDRGHGNGDYSVLDRYGDLVAEVEKADAELIVAAVNAYKP